MALGDATFNDLGGAVSDLFQGAADQYKIQGLQFEEQNYDAAAALAEQNKQFTATSTAIQQGQQERQLYTSIGKTTAQVAGAGLDLSGSNLDLLRSSAQQGATTTAAIGQQGLITEAGYQEQAESYTNMASATAAAIQGEKLSEEGSYIAGGLKLAGAVASLIPGGSTLSSVVGSVLGPQNGGDAGMGGWS
jgi:hypothetical protein